MIDRIQKIRDLSKLPIKTNDELKRVEIIVLKYKENPEVIDECIRRVVHNTTWPFKLTIYDNRPNPANTSKIWNFIVNESACEYICIIDSDAFVPEVEPCWLTRLMESIDRTGVVVPMGDHVGGSNRAGAADPYPSERPQNGIWSAFCGLYKKSVIRQLGNFDEHFYLYGQDSFFAWKCQKQIGGAVYRTDVFVQHTGSHSAKKADSEGELDREADKLYAASLYRLKTQGKV